MAWNGNFLFSWLWRTSPPVSNAQSRNSHSVGDWEPDITRLLEHMKAGELEKTIRLLELVESQAKSRAYQGGHQPGQFFVGAGAPVAV